MGSDRICVHELLSILAGYLHFCEIQEIDGFSQISKFRLDIDYFIVEQNNDEMILKR